MITLVDYAAGNLTSVKRALDALGIENEITGSPVRIDKAKRIIFPGVGNACSAMAHLEKTKVAAALKRAASVGVPILGICLGMQIMLASSEEGDTECLGLFDGEVKLLRPGDNTLKIPHMGWNNLKYSKPKHAVFDGIESRAEFYFVHSYYAALKSKKDVVARAEHGVDFAAAIARDNLIAVQFHPEKSGEVGLRLLKNFAEGKTC